MKASNSLLDKKNFKCFFCKKKGDKEDCPKYKDFKC